MESSIEEIEARIEEAETKRERAPRITVVAVVATAAAASAVVARASAEAASSCARFTSLSAFNRIEAVLVPWRFSSSCARRFCAAAEAARGAAVSFCTVSYTHLTLPTSDLV